MDLLIIAVAGAFLAKELRKLHLAAIARPSWVAISPRAPGPAITASVDNASTSRALVRKYASFEYSCRCLGSTSKPDKLLVRWISEAGFRDVSILLFRSGGGGDRRLLRQLGLAPDGAKCALDHTRNRYSCPVRFSSDAERCGFRRARLCGLWRRLYRCLFGLVMGG